MDHFVYAPSHWGTPLLRNVVSHWLGAYTEWAMHSPKYYFEIDWIITNTIKYYFIEVIDGFVQYYIILIARYWGQHSLAPGHQHESNGCYYATLQESINLTTRILSKSVKRLRAKLFREKNKHMLTFYVITPHSYAQIPKIRSQVKPWPTYSTQSISLLLMSWRRKEPEHQQPWLNRDNTVPAC